MQRWPEGVIAGLEYLLMFRTDPEADVDQLYATILEGKSIIFSPTQILEALTEALKSSVDLSKLLEQPHSDERLRSVFSALKRKLGTEIGGKDN